MYPLLNIRLVDPGMPIIPIAIDSKHQQPLRIARTGVSVTSLHWPWASANARILLPDVGVVFFLTPPGGLCKQPQAGTKVEQNPLELCEILSFGANQLH